MLVLIVIDGLVHHIGTQHLQYIPGAITGGAAVGSMGGIDRLLHQILGSDQVVGFFPLVYIGTACALEPNIELDLINVVALNQIGMTLQMIADQIDLFIAETSK